MNFIIEPGSLADIDELERLYDELNDHLSVTINYPGFIRFVRMRLPVWMIIVCLLPDIRSFLHRYELVPSLRRFTFYA